MLNINREVKDMEKMILRFMVGFAAALFLTHLSACAQISTNGTPPRYVGLGEHENVTQGLSLALSSGEKPNPTPPVIKSAYAVDRERYGEVLKIYLEAEDPNGEMFKIATSVDQVGYGHYPIDFIILKPQYRKSFKGYIQWDTFSSRAPYLDEWTIIYVKVAVLDKEGRASNEFELPFTFVTGVSPAPKPPAPLDQGDVAKLGNISIDLFNPRVMGGGGNRD